MKVQLVRKNKEEARPTILEVDEKTTYAPEHFYGVVDKYDKTRGFIVREKYMKGEYRAICLESMTEGNTFIDLVSPDFSTVIHTALRLNFEVFQFDTAQELMAWLAEK